MEKRRKSRAGKTRALVNKLFAALDALPLALPAALAAFSLVAVGLLLLGQLRNELIWPLGSTAALVSAFIVVRSTRGMERPGNKKEQRICDALVVLGVLVWAVFNMAYSAQHVFTDRDPATYAVAGAWLVEHNDLSIETAPFLGGVHNTSYFSAGFWGIVDDETTAYAQGNHLLPALLGLGGRIVGMDHIFALNAVIGAVALLAIYGFARLLAKPRWAVVVTAALAASLPFIYFSRDTYTEPLMAVFVFGALSLLWVAQKLQKPWLWLMAGLVGGATALVRIDGYLVIAALVAFIFMYMALANKKERIKSTINVLLMATGLGLAGWLGLTDVQQLAPQYFSDKKDLIGLELKAIAGIAVVGAVAVALSWRTRLLNKLDAATKGWRGYAVFALIVIGALILASRPFWYTSYAGSPSGVVTALQELGGVAVERRDYTEQSLSWVVWYIGPVLAIFGFIGLAIAAKRAMYQRNLLLVAGLLIVVFTSVVYFIRPSITPDQIWAARRFLPVVIPGLVVFAVIALDRFSQLPSRRLWGADSKVVTAVLSTVAVVSPLILSGSFLFVQPKAQLARAQGVCDTVPDDAGVLWIGQARSQAVHPTRVFCDIPSAGFGGRVFRPPIPDQGALRDIANSAEASGVRPVIGLYSHQQELIEHMTTGKLTTVDSPTELALERTLFRPPHKVVERRTIIQLGEIRKDGMVIPLDR